jgi:16S rRNA uridine-516 pseudouridylate synthase and related pseudouridylate synthases
MRIAKYIANAGICSRRDAEKLIEKKEVKVNGILCTHPSLKITEKDKVYVFGKILKSNDKLRIGNL